jgi:hypothetical protein
MFNYFKEKNHRIYILTAIVLACLIIGAFSYYFKEASVNESQVVSSYDECVAAGNKILETYPSQCVTEDGQTFSQEIDPQPDMSKEIQVTNPTTNQLIEKTLVVSGNISGTWLFEGQSSMKLYDTNNNVVAEGIITTTSDWMTTNLVPFTGTLNFDQPDPQKGKLVIENANPSGLEENKKEFEVSIYFK